MGAEPSVGDSEPTPPIEDLGLLLSLDPDSLSPLPLGPLLWVAIVGEDGSKTTEEVGESSSKSKSAAKSFFEPVRFRGGVEFPEPLLMSISLFAKAEIGSDVTDDEEPVYPSVFRLDAFCALVAPMTTGVPVEGGVPSSKIVSC